MDKKYVTMTRKYVIRVVDVNFPTIANVLMEVRRLNIIKIIRSTLGFTENVI